MAQPHPTGQPHSRPAASWSSGLFGCLSDFSTCCYGLWCLPCLYGENTNKIHGGGCCGHCCLYGCCACFACFFAEGNRTDLRNKHSLPEDPCGDCCVHCWCSPCAVCQEARELKAQSSRVPPSAGHLMALVEQRMA